MKSGNPALGARLFDNLGSHSGTDAMTVEGTINKVITALLILIASATASWLFIPESSMFAALIGSSILGLVIAIFTIFKKSAAPTTVPMYAVVEGVVIGLLSMFFETIFPGIVIQAVILTFGTLGAMLFAYKTGIIQVTENFKAGVFAATGAICLIYLVSFVAGLFGANIPYIHDNGWIGILFSLFVVVIAALNLVLDFDFIEKGAQQGAPKYMEWYGAFGLLVTLIWLYLEILRLLAKLRSRN
jgi:uncharacterized YccA/Bax inhibitor family protein